MVIKKQSIPLKSKKRKTRPLYTLTGIVKRHPDGFGFFIPEDSQHPDVYLSQRQMPYLMNNDKVNISVFPRKYRKGLFEGKILKILKRAQNHVIGPYFPLSDKTGLISDNSYQWGENLKIQLKENQTPKKGEWVQAKILYWPGSPQGFKGEITCSLGVFPNALEDNIRAVQKHHIPSVFPLNCQKEAKALPLHPSESTLHHRKDLRSLAFVTIDGKTAQDFDDAIYVKTHTKGWLLYVAIADVSHYVKKDSFLDKEAQQRGNSTYFPGFTLPMLPEKLSNDLCSLKPYKNRLAFVTEIHFNQKGEKEKTKFYSAVIQSRARLTYGSAQSIIDQVHTPSETYLEEKQEGEKHQETEITTLSHSVLENVRSAGNLAKQLLKQRSKNHFINLNIPETEISLNELGEPLDISQKPRLFSHQLIEELMLAANKAVAEFLQKHKIPTLYRIHDPPKSESLKRLELFTQSIGIPIGFENSRFKGLANKRKEPKSTEKLVPVKKGIRPDEYIKIKLSEPNLQKKISYLIQQFTDHPLSEVVQTLVLRSLSQAVYSARSKSHFGLNTKYYTHFTSPIRRYSDLIIHRILKSALEKQTSPYKKQDLESIAEISSACEQRSVKAERQIKDIKRTRFIKKYLGKEMEGIISNCTRFGFFVKLRLFDIEGLVQMKSLKGQWEFKEPLLELRSKSSHQRFKMGDSVIIQVVASNIDTGQIDFKLKAHKGKKISKKPRRERSHPPGRPRKTLSHRYPRTLKNQDKVMRSRKNKKIACAKKRKKNKN
ncbi:MAG: RNB domain-containing ribonuclease [Bdellovibrionales bacterium]|nr:RNB domain-containing ribonuclease [Bdellovibrionales bacterium]